MNDFPRMIYKAGGPEEIHGGRFHTHIVHDVDELDAALADGWHLTTPDAADAAAPKPKDEADDDAPATRAELEQKATKLGIEFSPRIGDAKLAERIEAALTGQN
jgi:hypothetical protein